MGGGGKDEGVVGMSEMSGNHGQVLEYLRRQRVHSSVIQVDDPIRTR